MDDYFNNLLNTPVLAAAPKYDSLDDFVDSLLPEGRRTLLGLKKKDLLPMLPDLKEKLKAKLAEVRMPSAQCRPAHGLHSSQVS